MAWLQGLNAPDLGLLLNGREFSQTQEMTEDFSQEITFGGGFGTDGAVSRTVRHADESTVTFQAVLLKEGVRRGLNDEDLLRGWRDFEIQVKRGSKVVTYRGCNWRRITIRSTLEQVTIDSEISVPGFTRN